jgi:hypothetical protein
MPDFCKSVKIGPECAVCANAINRKKIENPLAEERGLLSTCLHK